MQAIDHPLICHTPRRWAEFLADRMLIRESILQLDKRGKRDWKALGDGELLAHARWKIADGAIGCKKELEDADTGLYLALRKRNLIDEVGLEAKRKDWSSTTVDEIVACAKRFIAEKGIQTKVGLSRANPKLYEALRNRDVLDKLEFEKKMRDWASMTDEEIIAFTISHITKNGITGRSELAHTDKGLYSALRKRHLLGRIGLPEKQRDWAVMTDGELVELAKGRLSEDGITGRGQLALEDQGLYGVLRERRLLGKIGLEKKKTDWASMDETQILECAKKLVIERGIAGRKDLARASSRLYEILKAKGLLDKIGLEGKNRCWAAMTDRQLAALARQFIIERRITGRTELSDKTRGDVGLYGVLLRRNLLNAVFSSIDCSAHKEAVDGVLDALNSFGDEK